MSLTHTVSRHCLSRKKKKKRNKRQQKRNELFSDQHRRNETKRNDRSVERTPSEHEAKEVNESAWERLAHKSDHIFSASASVFQVRDQFTFSFFFPLKKYFISILGCRGI